MGLAVAGRFMPENENWFSAYLTRVGANKKYVGHISNYVRHVLKYLRHIFPWLQGEGKKSKNGFRFSV